MNKEYAKSIAYKIQEMGFKTLYLTVPDQYRWKNEGHTGPAPDGWNEIKLIISIEDIKSLE